jgi:hypothetical protein
MNESEIRRFGYLEWSWQEIAVALHLVFGGLRPFKRSSRAPTELRAYSPKNRPRLTSTGH